MILKIILKLNLKVVNNGKRRIRQYNNFKWWGWNEVKFEFLDLVELDEEEYVVLLPVSEEGEEDEGEVVILKLEDTDEDSEEESYVGVEDEEILNKVFAIFKEKYKDEFNFVDED